MINTIRCHCRMLGHVHRAMRSYWTVLQDQWRS